MSIYSLSRLERLYIQLQTAFNTIPNTAGTATVAIGDYVRHIKATLNNEVSLLVRKDKTGSRTATSGMAGRRYGKWSVDLSLSPSGSAGVAPNADELLQAVFGQTPTLLTTGTFAISGTTLASPSVVTCAAHGQTVGSVVAITITGNGTTAASLNGPWMATATTATTLTLIGNLATQGGVATGNVLVASVKYALSDNIVSLAVHSYRKGTGGETTLNQRVAFGCVAHDATFNMGADIAEWSVNGECMWVHDSDNWSVADSYQKGGLTTNIAEPVGTPSANGGIIAGFTGGLVLNGQPVAAVRSATLKISTGNQVIKDHYGSFYPDSAEGDLRSVSVSFSLYDDDSTGQQALRQLGISKTPVDAVFTMGTSPYSTVMFYVKGIQLAPLALDDGQSRYVYTIADSPAYGSSPANKDEVALWIV